MDALTKKYTVIGNALASLGKALDYYQTWEDEQANISKTIANIGFSYDEMLITFRDSSIQRFEYSVDTLWRYLKEYLLIKHGISPAITTSPSFILRETSRIGIITEQEAEKLVTMIKSRNMTSHIYKQEIAEIIMKSLPEYYETMQEVIQKIAP